MKLPIPQPSAYNEPMKILRAFVILALFLSVCVLGGCGAGNTNTNINATSASPNPAVDNSNSAKTNIEELSMVINVPFEPDDIVWKVNSDEKKLTAVLRFTSEDADRIATDAATRQAPENATLSSESWFPAELIAQSEMTGDDSLNGVAYAADAFLQIPYTSGQIVRIDGTDYFVVELNSQ